MSGSGWPPPRIDPEHRQCNPVGLSLYFETRFPPRTAQRPDQTASRPAFEARLARFLVGNFFGPPADVASVANLRAAADLGAIAVSGWASGSITGNLNKMPEKVEEQWRSFFLFKSFTAR